MKVTYLFNYNLVNQFYKDVIDWQISENIKAFNILIGKTVGKKPIGIYRKNSKDQTLKIRAFVMNFS